MKKLTRKALMINGVERFALCELETDTLAEVLRRLGLTGVKVGCGTGVCGACSVILNGEVIRSCTRRMKNVPDHSEITTIEGIGTPQHLHPLQQAWVTYGAAQCGFCSPGFIVSAYGLLQENINPTREDVREWFRKHHNVCRCTGYKPLVDAVMAAAKCMRGECTMDDLKFDPTGKDIYGSAMPRPTGVAKVCGLTDYGDDIARKMPEGTAHLAVVISEVAHANIINIDTSEAEKMPGVYKVMTAKDVKGSNNLGFPAFIPRQKGQGLPEFPMICGKKICKRGDIVALVAADTREHARAAAKMVKQELEILPSYMSLPEAVMPGAARLNPDLPNFYMEQPLIKGEDPEELFDEADYVVEGSFYSQHEPHLPIEPDVVQAYWDEDDIMTIQCKTQNLYESVAAVAPVIGLPPERIRIICNPAGGSFGYSMTALTFALCATAVQNLDMPCSLVLSYEEFNHITGKRAATYTNGKLGLDKDGKIVAVEYDIAMDGGAYTSVGTLLLPNLVEVAFHGYNIPNIKALARGCVTNQAYVTAFRGFGAPQINVPCESLVDMAAEKAGLDPWLVHYVNAARPGDTSINQRPFHEYPYPELLEKIKPVYDEYKAEAEAARAEGRAVGVGISMGGFHVSIGAFDSAELDVELRPDGKIAEYTTWEDVGQGGDIGALTHMVKALEPMGVKPEDIILVLNDTKLCPDTGVAASSRSHYMGGLAALDAARQLMDAMRKPDGTWRTYDEMVAEGIPTKYRGHYDLSNSGLSLMLDPNTGEGDRIPTYSYTVNVALVEVDTNTGKTTVKRMTTCADIGVIGNLLAVEGQGYGGLSHSIGFALSEDYDPTKKTSGNMAGCGIPTIDAIPDDFNLMFAENPRVNGPHGSGGCSEGFQSSAHMAVINAINNACGVRIYELPATPAKVKAALEKKARGEDLTPPKYFLGSDFEDEMELIKANPL